jgi:hypothetical protein
MTAAIFLLFVYTGLSLLIYFYWPPQIYLVVVLRQALRPLSDFSARSQT